MNTRKQRDDSSSYNGVDVGLRALEDEILLKARFEDAWTTEFGRVFQMGTTLTKKDPLL